METLLSRWGNSLAVRIPKAAVEKAGLRAGDRLEIEVRDDGDVVLRPRRCLLELADLLAGITPENRPAETDWGGPVGGETW